MLRINLIAEKKSDTVLEICAVILRLPILISYHNTRKLSLNIKLVCFHLLLLIIKRLLHEVTYGTTYTGRRDDRLFCRGSVMLFNVCVHWLNSSRIVHEAHGFVAACRRLHNDVCCQLIDLYVNHTKLLMKYT